MKNYEMTETEERFAELLWQNEPLLSGELVKLCSADFQWKKSTTYTMLKKLCDGGIFKNEQSVITSLISKEDYNAERSRRFVEKTYSGSLPRFIAAFSGGDKLSKEQVAALKKLIEEHEEA